MCPLGSELVSSGQSPRIDMRGSNEERGFVLVGGLGNPPQVGNLHYIAVSLSGFWSVTGFGTGAPLGSRGGVEVPGRGGFLL